MNSKTRHEILLEESHKAEVLYAKAMLPSYSREIEAVHDIEDRCSLTELQRWHRAPPIEFVPLQTP